jgi:hypothetical protein
MKDLVYEITFVGFDKQQAKEAATALGLEERTLRAKLGGLVGRGRDKKFYRAVAYDDFKSHEVGKGGIESDLYVLNNDGPQLPSTNVSSTGTTINYQDKGTPILVFHEKQLYKRDQNNARLNPLEGKTGTLANVLENYQELIPGDAQANRVPGQGTVHPK